MNKIRCSWVVLLRPVLDFLHEVCPTRGSQAQPPLLLLSTVFPPCKRTLKEKRMTRGKNPRRRPHTMACGYTGEPSPWAVKLAADTKVGEQDLQGWRRTGNNISLSRRSRAKSTVEEPSRRKMTLLFQRTRSQMKNFEASNGGFEKEVERKRLFY